MSAVSKIQPSLWFAGNAKEAVDFYTSIFPSSSIKGVETYTSAGQEHHQMEVGSVMSVEFNLNGIDFIAINGPPIFHFSEAVSFTINCEDQKEVDYYWNTLGEGGKPSQCGWIKDKYGLSWQVNAKCLDDFLRRGTEKQRTAVMAAMMKMVKLDVQELQKAFEDAA
jgi:predicted 3-demethylubiquinone-9 3-methyltransferase (glyoxalase superfamily)